MTESTTRDQAQLREAVRQRYAAAATRVAQDHTWAESALPVVDTDTCCSTDAACSCEFTGDNKRVITSDLYAVDEVADLPSVAVLASLGCGNPTALAELKPGETVLDLGSGGGIDVLLSAKRVGPTGFAYSLDMTDEMLALAQRNAAEVDVQNVRFLKGEIEHIPLPDRSVDVVISNCVINLSIDKGQVLREAFRVLKPGGRFAVSDVVVQGHLPAEIRSSMEQWVGCVAGALEEDTYRLLLADAGFVDVGVEVIRVYDARAAGSSEAQAATFATFEAMAGRLVSAFVRAVRREEQAPTSVSIVDVPEVIPSAGCCSPPAQASCCAPEQKSSCCGNLTSTSPVICGCR
jgi:SAM-dependent methyltransferase